MRLVRCERAELPSSVRPYFEWEHFRATPIASVSCPLMLAAVAAAAPDPQIVQMLMAANPNLTIKD
jgi:hypothetical protein